MIINVPIATGSVPPDTTEHPLLTTITMTLPNSSTPLLGGSGLRGFSVGPKLLWRTGAILGYFALCVKWDRFLTTSPRRYSCCRYDDRRIWRSWAQEEGGHNP